MATATTRVASKIKKLRLKEGDVVRAVKVPALDSDNDCKSCNTFWSGPMQQAVQQAVKNKAKLIVDRIDESGNGTFYARIGDDDTWWFCQCAGIKRVSGSKVENVSNAEIMALLATRHELATDTTELTSAKIKFLEKQIDLIDEHIKELREK